MSPAGLNACRCQKVLPCAEGCTTEQCQEREFFFTSAVCPLESDCRPEHCRSLTSFISICRQHRPQCSMCNSWSQHQSSYEKQFVRTKSGVGECVWERCKLREWFLMLQISPSWIVCEMCDILYTSSSFAHHLLNSKATSEVSASLVKTQPLVLFYNKKQPLGWTEKILKELSVKPVWNTKKPI